MRSSHLLALTVVTAVLAVLVVNFNQPAPVSAIVVPPPPRVLAAEHPLIEGEVSAPSDEALETEQEDALTAEAEAMATSTTTTAARPSGSSGSSSSSPATTAPPKTTTKAPSSGSYNSAMESDFYGRINSLRKSNGLSGLTANSSLASYARSWAKKMAQSGSLAHSNIGSLIPPWSSVGENVGKGGSVSGIFGALSGSSPHLANMLGDFTHVGVGVWVDSGGTIWTVHVFAR